MAEMPKTMQEVLDGIIAERGGAGCFDTKAMLAARGLVRVMAAVNEGDVSKAGSIATLEAMLPPVVEVAAGPKPDWSLLNDKQVWIGEQLYNIACGRRPSHPPHRQKSSTYWSAVEAAHIADAVMQRGPHAKLTDDERHELRGCLSSVVWAASTTILNLFPEHLLVQGAPYGLPPEPEPLPRSDNVVPLTRTSASEKMWPSDNVAPTLAVSVPLEERYPLSSLPPVNRW